MVVGSTSTGERTCSLDECFPRGSYANTRLPLDSIVASNDIVKMKADSANGAHAETINNIPKSRPSSNLSPVTSSSTFSNLELGSLDLDDHLVAFTCNNDILLLAPYTHLESFA